MPEISGVYFCAMAENAAEALMRRYLPELTTLISRPPALACDLFSRGVIGRELYREMIDLKNSRSVQDKSMSICDAVLSSIHMTPAHLVEFVEAAKQDSPAVAAVCEMMCKDPTYGKGKTDETNDSMLW